MWCTCVCCVGVMSMCVQSTYETTKHDKLTHFYPTHQSLQLDISQVIVGKFLLNWTNILNSENLDDCRGTPMNLGRIVWRGVEWSTRGLQLAQEFQKRPPMLEFYINRYVMPRPGESNFSFSAVSILCEMKHEAPVCNIVSPGTYGFGLKVGICMVNGPCAVPFFFFRFYLFSGRNVGMYSMDT